MIEDSQLLEALRHRYNAGERFKYVVFWGHKQSKSGVTASCFSQSYEASFMADGDQYLTAEHYMMAEKARLFGDLQTGGDILRAATPGAAKALGRKVHGFDESAWRMHRYTTVCRANEAKFSADAALRDYLLQSGERVLVEASPVDNVWGIGLARDAPDIDNPNTWRGLNLLWFALMEVRRRLLQSRP